MTLLLRVIILILCGLFVFSPIWISTTIAPKWEMQISSGTSISSWIEQKICVKDPNVQFLMYHYIRDHDRSDTVITRDLSVAPALFERHMQKLSDMSKQGKIMLMKWDDFLEGVRSGCFPGKNIWILTADDGWIDMRDYLVPIATKYSVPFFLGIITNRLDTSGFLSTRDVEAIAKNPLMTISSHSISHTDNSKLDILTETKEMCESRDVLRKLSGQEVDTYIYPSGRFAPDIALPTAKNCGYTLAWSTQFGTDYNDHTGSLFAINRIRMNSETDPHFFEALISKIENRETMK